MPRMTLTAWTVVAQIVASIATVLYLIASYYLWRVTKRAADAAVAQASAAEKAADAAREQAIQTAKAVAVAEHQARIAEEQFKLSRQMFVADSQPLVVFESAPSFVFPQPTGTLFQVLFTIRNQGKTTATRVRWRAQILVGDSLLLDQTTPNATEVGPNQSVSGQIESSVPGTVPQPASTVRLATYIELQYVNPLDNKYQHSMCEARRDPQTGEITFVPFIGRDISDTPTGYCLGVPFP